MDIQVPSTILSSYTCSSLNIKTEYQITKSTKEYSTTISTIKHIFLSPYEYLNPCIIFLEKSPVIYKKTNSIWIKDNEFIPVVRDMPYFRNSHALDIELLNQVSIISNELRPLSICGTGISSYAISHMRKQLSVPSMITVQYLQLSEIDKFSLIDLIVLMEKEFTLSNIKKCLLKLKIGNHIVVRCTSQRNSDLKYLIYNVATLFYKVTICASSVRNPYHPTFDIVFTGYQGSSIDRLYTYDDLNYDQWLDNIFEELEKSRLDFQTRIENRMKWIDLKKILRYNAIKSIKWCKTYNVPINYFYIQSPINQVIKNDDKSSKIFPNEEINNVPWTTVEGQYSVIYASHAETMITLISKHLPDPLSNYVLTDATSNVGGFVLVASKYFKKVHAIELSETNMHALEHNLNIYKRSNVRTYLDDCTVTLASLEQDVVFIDPPWGGTYGYAESSIDIKLSGMTMADMVNTYRKSMFVLRLPKNFAFNEFMNNVLRRSIKIYKIANYFLAIL